MSDGDILFNFKRIKKAREIGFIFPSIYVRMQYEFSRPQF